jgi:hypothetical protein
MKGRTAHWGAREWSRNLDDLVPDRAHPQAFPSTYPMDLMGRIRVKLTVEDGNLVAYGFGGQKVVIPPASVGGIYTVRRFTFGKFISHDGALIVLDRENGVLLRADGLWETYGEVKKVAHAAKIEQVTHLYGGNWKQNQSQSRGSTSYRSTSSRAVTRFTKAHGYQRLRTRPRGSVPQAWALVVLCCLVMASFAFLGVVPSLLLPEWFGKVRTLISIVGVALGLAAGAWVFGALRHVWQDGLRWAGASWVAGGLAPLHRFFTRRREHEGTWLVFANIALIALFGLLVVFGPGVLVASVSHGVRDSNLVAELRADGVTTQGALIDVPDIQVDDKGNTTSTDVPTLAWGADNQVTDPSIGGRPLPLDADDAEGTDVPETIVYLRSDPTVAAAAQQISGSVWHGAPTANVISGGIFTVALPPFFIFLVLRLRSLRWRRAKDMVEGLTAT